MMRTALLLAAWSAGSAFELALEHAFGVSAPFSPRGTVLEVTPGAPKSKVVRAVPETLKLEGANATVLPRSYEPSKTVPSMSRPS